MAKQTVTEFRRNHLVYQFGWFDQNSRDTRMAADLPVFFLHLHICSQTKSADCIPSILCAPMYVEQLSGETITNSVTFIVGGFTSAIVPSAVSENADAPTVNPFDRPDHWSVRSGGRYWTIRCHNCRHLPGVCSHVGTVFLAAAEAHRKLLSCRSEYPGTGGRGFVSGDHRQ